MSNIMLAYLKDLAANNNREWYHENAVYRKEAEQAFEKLVATLIERIRRFDPELPDLEVKKLTFKMVRDTRFSKDKSPYNPAFRAHISYHGKDPIPVGYYIAIRPYDASFIGGGLFADMFKEATTMVRNYLYEHPQEWKNIIENPDFKQRFEVGGTSLKNMPKEYIDSEVEHIKNKSWYIEETLPDGMLEEEEETWISYIVSEFEKMKPFNDYLNAALEKFEMPKRP